MGYKRNRNWWPDEWPEWPDNSVARKAVADLYEIGMYILEAPASRRKERAKNLEQRAATFLRELSSGERNKVALLVQLWTRNAFLIQTIKWKRETEGLEAVKPLRPQWYTAQWKMEKAEEAAENMGLEAYEYFKCKQGEFFLVLEERDEKGNYREFPDHSELRRQWYAHEAITEPVPWAWEKMIGVCLQFTPKESRASWQFWSFLVAVATLVGTVATLVVTFVFGAIELTQ